MPKYNVYLYPEMVLHVRGLEADDACQAIHRAIDLAEAIHLDAGGDASKGPIYAEGFVRYVVDPIVDGQPDYCQRQTYLDRAHLVADERDRETGIPCYEHPDTTITVGAPPTPAS
jgi:hypothetical protein